MSIEIIWIGDNVHMLNYCIIHMTCIHLVASLVVSVKLEDRRWVSLAPQSPGAPLKRTFKCTISPYSSPPFETREGNWADWGSGFTGPMCTKVYELPFDHLPQRRHFRHSRGARILLSKRSESPLKGDSPTLNISFKLNTLINICPGTPVLLQNQGVFCFF